MWLKRNEYQTLLLGTLLVTHVKTRLDLVYQCFMWKGSGVLTLFLSCVWQDRHASNCVISLPRNLMRSVSIKNKMSKPYEIIKSDQISRSVVSDSLRPHESQHARPPCPSPTPRIHWDSCLSSHWCHPAISSSVVPISSCPQSLPASESFPMSYLLAWGGQSTGVSASASFLPKKSQGWSPV